MVWYGGAPRPLDVIYFLKAKTKSFSPFGPNFFKLSLPEAYASSELLRFTNSIIQPKYFHTWTYSDVAVLEHLDFSQLAASSHISIQRLIGREDRFGA